MHSARGRPRRHSCIRGYSYRTVSFSVKCREP